MTDHGLCTRGDGRAIRYPSSGLCEPCYKRDYFKRTYKRKPNASERTDPCTYAYAHVKLTKYRGRAKDQVCVDCGLQAQEWSYNGGSEYEQTGTVEYVSDGYRYTSELSWSPWIWDYSPRCRKCHRIYDGKADAA